MESATKSSTPYDPTEIVHLIRDYYELLARLRYFPSSFIKYPPHSPAIDVKLAASLGMEPQIISLLELLPYIEGYSNEDEFILGGSFADFRQKGALETSRDPGFKDPDLRKGWNEENGPYVRPWVLVLNECGNHGAILYFDTKSGHITIEQQAYGGIIDPYFYGTSGRTYNTTPNENSIEFLPSRSASSLFADFSNRLITLEWIPLKWFLPIIVHEGDPIHWELKMMFVMYGWKCGDSSSKLDGGGFDAAAERWKEFARVRDKVFDDRELGKMKELLLDKERREWELHDFELRQGNGAVKVSSESFPDETKGLQDDFESKLEVVQNAEKEFSEELRKKGFTRADLDKSFENEWRNHLQGKINLCERNLDWWKSDKGKQYADQAKMKKERDEMEAWKRRFVDAGKEPKTALEAIKPR
ncbi:hypothetical protein D0Z07_1209 [Hyphodiscus hymeniophilus]|uniref:Uncharacterized protein n=1 Tax=Hyphodiscus hymeniophilus TaxID=353542 RepID=A0A9P6VPP2_9HELO|nr:hypothetical protein D0Z07_1209 [Hyphodiscus hymeniophilus]